jgi:hypothetical protein
MIISIDVGKSFDKIQHFFMKNVLMKLEIEEIFLNIIKAVFGKSMANVIRNEEKNKTKTFPLKSRAR